MPVTTQFVSAGLLDGDVSQQRLVVGLSRSFVKGACSHRNGSRGRGLGGGVGVGRRRKEGAARWEGNEGQFPLCLKLRVVTVTFSWWWSRHSFRHGL